MYFILFFFSSRRRHTRSKRDWSSDVCSSDLEKAEDFKKLFEQAQIETQSVYGNKDLYIEKIIYPARHIEIQLIADHYGKVLHLRSEERRVGKECRSGRARLT